MMIKTIISSILSILILASISSIVYTEIASPLQHSYATPPTIPPLPLPDIVLNGSPTVGETGEIVMTFVYNSSGWIFEDPIIKMSIQGNDNELYTITNITSNVHTGDPSVFEPYDYLTQSQRAIPDYPYVVKGTVKILKEGFHDFIGVGLEEISNIRVTFAIDGSRHMPYSMYIAEGHTFLDHLGSVRGASDDSTPRLQLPPPTPVTAPKDNSVGLTHQEMMAELEDYIASVYLEKKLSHTSLLDELQNIRLTVPQIKEFLKNKVSISDDDDIHNLVAMIPADYEMISGFAVGQTSHFASFNISGRVTAPMDYIEPGNINIHGIEVCALDYNPSNNEFVTLNTTTDNETACGYTSQLGVYLIENIINHDPNDDDVSNTDVDLVIRVTSRGDNELIVQNSTRQPYVQDSARIDNFNETSAITNFQLTNGTAGAGRIINAISDGREFFDNYEISPQKLTVNWQHDAGTSVFEFISDGSAFYDPPSDTIFLSGDVNNDFFEDISFQRWVILHEFGHYIMDIAGVIPVRGGCLFPHFITTTSGISCAWIEGWADFVPHLVDDSPELLLSHVPPTSPGRLIRDYSINLERDHVYFDDGGSRTGFRFLKTIADLNFGHVVEGRVAAALWDIKDTIVHDYADQAGNMLDGAILDDQALGDDEIMAVFKSGAYFGFEDFYNAWNEQGNPSIKNIMQLHGMIFATNRDRIILSDEGVEIVTLNLTSGRENASSIQLPINKENLRAIVQADRNNIIDADLSGVFIQKLVPIDTTLPNRLNSSLHEDLRHQENGIIRFGLGDSITYNITDPSYRQADTYSFQAVVFNLNNTRSGTGNMTIILQAPPVCEVQITTDSINFGGLANGEASNDLSFITINNPGSQTVLPGITAKHWISSADPDVIVMDAQQTRWALDSSASYDLKTPLSFNVAQNTGMSLASGDTSNVYLQVLVDLIDDAYAGQTTQDLTVTSTCE